MYSEEIQRMAISVTDSLINNHGLSVVDIGGHPLPQEEVQQLIASALAECKSGTVPTEEIAIEKAPSD